MKKYILILAIAAFLTQTAYALNLDRVKEHFLKSEWKQAIREGESLLAKADRDSEDLDQLYYYLGLCYYKDGNYLRSTDIFEIILKEFPRSKFAKPARKALSEAKARLPDKPEPQFEPARESRSEPETEAEPDLVLAEDLQQSAKLKPAQRSQDEILFFVQVGAFSNSRNAQKLVKKLTGSGFPASSVSSMSKNKPIWKVRVGPYESINSSKAAAKKLTKLGLPTKIIP